MSAESLSGQLFVNNPNYNFSGNSLYYQVSNIINDKATSGFKNNIISTGIGTKFEQYRNVYISSGLNFSHDKLEVNSSASPALKKQKGTFTDLAFDYGVSLDKRDKVFSPTDGYISSFSGAIPIYADAGSISNTYSFSKYQGITENVVGAFKLQASAINGLSDKDVRLSKRLFTSNTRLRGFESGKIGPKDGKDYIGGNYSITSNFELNLPNLLPESTKTDVGLFLDFGNLWGVDYSSSLDDSNKIRSSAGANVSWISPAGPMTFVFSQNLSKANTDVTEGFNFRLGTTF